MLEDKILRSLREDCHFDPALPLVVGVSGGADSLSLAHCLYKQGLKIIVGHFDHNLRPSSGREAAQISGLMAEWGLPVEVGKGAVREVAEQKRVGVEEAARICRYEFLLGLAESRKAQAVVVAHTADDQVETVLMHFLRGAGVEGLSGMRQVNFLNSIHAGIPIFRPMLNVFKSEVLAYCQEQHLDFVTDETNQDRSFFRNRLRLEVIPALEAVNPAFKNVVLRNAEAVRFDREILEHLQDQAFANCLQPSAHQGYLTLDRKKFLSLSEGLQRRVILQTASSLRPDARDFGLIAVKRALKGIQEFTPRLEFTDGLQIWVEEAVFHVTPLGTEPELTHWPQLPQRQSFALRVGGKMELKNGWSLEAKRIDRQTYHAIPEDQRIDPLHAFLNPADLESPLQVRPANPGERWSPLGMGLKHQKLSDFYINNKIPRSARGLWPLVLSGGSIVWVAGLRIAQAWRLQGDEAEVLHLQLQKQ